MSRLTKIELGTITATAVWLAAHAFPGHTLADWMGSAFTVLWTMLGLGIVVGWIKTGGDRHL